MSHPRDTFEVHGYYEEITHRVGDKLVFLGTREIPEPVERLLGISGAREYTLTEPLTLQKGHKQVTIKASKEKPLAVRGVAQALCGRPLKELVDGSMIDALPRRESRTLRQ